MKLFIAFVIGLWAFAATASEDYTLLEIGGKELKRSYVEELWQGLFPPGQAPDFDSMEEPVKSNLLRGIIGQELIFDQANATGFEKNPEVQKELEAAKRKILVSAFIESKTSELVSEADIKEAYDKVVEESKGEEEISARHILVEEEALANEIRGKLKTGAKFEALAAEFSKDPGSKVRGGELGWFGKGRMVKAFEETAWSLKKGEISEPVKSQFGWHIIQVDDRRRKKVPTLSQLRPQLRAQLQEKALNGYVSDLLKDNPVNYYNAKGEKQPLDLKTE